MCIACGFASQAHAVFDFKDIEYWVGTGSNRAALVVDWDEGSTAIPARVWGYRWNGVAHGRDMLLAIVAADPRLYAKLGDSLANPTKVFGLGYDANADGTFGLDDGTAFNDDGIAIGSAPFFPTTAIDPNDNYAEGWTFGFWHYGVSANSPYAGGAWSDFDFGMALRTLADGSWDSWAIETSTTPPFTTFAENPVAATPPFPRGDFDLDGHVTPADYSAWRQSFGSTAQLAADVSGNGVIDAADYTIWRDHLGAANAPAAGFGLSVPEPATLWSGLWPCIFLWRSVFLRRKDKTS
jgi:dockerin type I repeat protein